MDVSARLTTVEEILPWREFYRREMGCQIVHDSLHSRPGWTLPYRLHFGDAGVGYGSVAVGGPWTGKPAIFEFFALPDFRARLFDLFEAVVTASDSTRIETQSNDPLLTVMLHTFAQNVISESILFHDKLTTSHAPRGAVFRRAVASDGLNISTDQLDSHGVVEVDGRVAGTGGILFHYNRPYGDIYMEVEEPYRRRGLGAYLVQELKRICHEQGSVPTARCNPTNIASRRTLQKAGFVPCGHILTGSISPRPGDARR